MFNPTILFMFYKPNDDFFLKMFKNYNLTLFATWSIARDDIQLPTMSDCYVNI